MVKKYKDMDNQLQNTTFQYICVNYIDYDK